MAEDRFIREWKKTNSVIAGVFTVAIIAGLPIIFRDYYFDILNVKYYFYCGCVIGMTVKSEAKRS